MSDNWPSALEAEMHIRSELSRVGLAFKERKNGFALICPHPHPGGGTNTHFNFSITKDGRGSSCFVCKPESQSWNKLCAVLGTEKFGSTGLYSADTVDRDLLATKASSILHAMNDESGDESFGHVPEGMTPWIGSWRGLSEPFLRSMHAHTWNQTFVTDTGHVICTPRIWFPCMQSGSYVGYVSRRLDTKDIMRYYNAPWMSTNNVLFPMDFARSYGGKAIVVVEGPVDALKLLHHGIPSVAILGTNNIGAKELLLLAYGYEKVFILFDNDPPNEQGVRPGEVAALEFYERARKVMQAQILKLPENIKDPGVLDTQGLDALKAYVLG